MKLPRHLLHQVIQTLRSIFAEKAPAEASVAQALREHPKWGGRDRRLFAESVYDIVRWRRWFWHLAGLPTTECEDPAANDEARLWLVWAAYWLSGGVTSPAPRDAAAPTPRALPDWPEVAGLTAEAVAQRAQEDVPEALRASWPDWLDTRLAEELGAAWPATRTALNEPAAVFLRTNPLRAKKAEVQLRLMNEGVLTTDIPGLPLALQLRQRAKAAATRTFKDGWFEIQDAASQHVAPLLQPSPGQTLVDFCAGAGGKTLHLAALMKNKGRLIALDIHESKLTELRRRAARAGASIIETITLPTEPDAANATLARLSGKADGVLLDVPCSGLGVVRRQPDTKWRLNEAEITHLLQQQADILRRGAALVRPGGLLVYATCSVLPSENARQIAAFLADPTNAHTWTLEEDFCLDPAIHGFDGFYAARLRRMNGIPQPQKKV